MVDWTNCEDWFQECQLDPDKHELWLGDNPPNAKKGKRVFWVSHETRGMANKDRCKDQDLIIFDSGVDDSGIVNPYMLHWHLSADANAVYKFTDRIKYQDSGLVFDALLGTRRPHRDFVWQWFENDTELKTAGYITYHRVAGNKQDFHVDQDVDLSAFKRSSSTVEYQGESVGYCSMIPTEIYSKTYVSLVAETYKPVNDWSFFTEKISKPMLARRPFVVISNRHYLRRLRSMGFKTFDSIIDESYDELQDDTARWSAAMTQLKKIVEMPRDHLLELSSDILDHNRQLMNQPWMRIFKNKLKELR